MTQLSLHLEARIPDMPDFYGPGYEPKLDRERLSRHCKAVLATLRAEPSRWWTYAELAMASGVPEGSCRTRVSNLVAWGFNVEARTRKDRFREVRIA